MFVSFIIISSEEEKIKENILNLKKVLRNEFEYEIIGSFGSNPSKQRNEAAKIALGEWLYFLDDDSIMSAHNIEELKLSLKKFPEAIVIGGPSVLNNQDSDWQKAIELVFTTDFGVGPIKARYLSVGQTRVSTEKELILCNMIIKKDAFVKQGGFNEELYPNEENEFLAKLVKYGLIVYAPQLVVFRRHRENILLFFKQMIRYGQGRTRHLLFSTDYSDFIYFAPLLAVLALIVFLFINPSIFAWIVLAYFIIITPTLIINVLYKKKISLLFLGFMAFSVCHMGYALGLILGFLDVKKRSAASPVLKKYN